MANQLVQAGASTPVTIIPSGKPLGFQQITALTVAAAFTVPAGATYALVMCTGANVNYRDDGTAPTATIGMQITAGAAPIPLANLAALQFIQQSATAVLNVSYYK
jgi:hypothetical protein